MYWKICCTNLNHCLLGGICDKEDVNFTQLYLVTDVFAFVDVLVKFWGQRVKGHGDSRQ